MPKPATAPARIDVAASVAPPALLTTNGSAAAAPMAAPMIIPSMASLSRPVWRA